MQEAVALSIAPPPAPHYRCDKSTTTMQDYSSEKCNSLSRFGDFIFTSDS